MVMCFGVIVSTKALTMLVIAGVEAGLGSQLWAFLSLFWSTWLLWVTVRLQRRRVFKAQKDDGGPDMQTFSPDGDGGV